MKRFTTLTILVLLTMLLLAGTASANPTVSGRVYDSGVIDAVYEWYPDISGGWANSNRSGERAVTDGVTPLLRSVQGQLTHTAFQLNTNSCASCHMTHTAIGANLLIRNTTTNTCMACHDGTMGFLDVNVPATAADFGGSVAAGTFGPLTNRTPSMHNVFGGVTLSGAPGGNRTGAAERAGASWSNAFSCASCHAPHGSHSIRLLDVNPNNIAARTVLDAAVYEVDGGRFRPAATTFNLNTYTFADGVFTYMSGVVGTVYAAPWVAGGGLVRIYDAIYYNPNTLSPDPTVTLADADLVRTFTRFFTINVATGRVIQTATQRADLLTALSAHGATAATPLTIDVPRGLQVRARVAAAHLGDLEAGARQLDFLDPTSYDALAYNLFCAACHTDYLPTISGSAQAGNLDPDETVADGVGLYSQKFRHTVNRGASTAVSPMPVRGGTAFTGANLTGTTVGSNRLMCLSCHFAHGTDASMMLLADNTRVSAGAGGIGTATHSGQNDVSGALAAGGSSALKRYINQASCWHCHVRSAATVFHNTDYFWAQFPNGPTW